MIVAEFSMVPMGSGTSAGDYVKAIHRILEDAEVSFIPGPMSTAVEAKSLQELFDLTEKASDRLVQMGVKRIITSIRIDMRLDKEISMQSKLSRVGSESN
ncbi:MAG: MTH1187 family thiamine-binding protein [Methanothrix sp.]|uniref:MTH1187 family thiamine-binding protein n=1 Tax=Methanothrix sp. TaxID=90426 RepID=UPI003C728EB1